MYEHGYRGKNSCGISFSNPFKCDDYALYIHVGSSLKMVDLTKQQVGQCFDEKEYLHKGMNRNNPDQLNFCETILLPLNF